MRHPWTRRVFVGALVGLGAALLFMRGLGVVGRLAPGVDLAVLLLVPGLGALSLLPQGSGGIAGALVLALSNTVAGGLISAGLGARGPLRWPARLAAIALYVGLYLVALLRRSGPG
jgi:hypothetical protein